MDYETDINSFMWANGNLNTVERGKRFNEYILTKLFDRTETELENNDINDGVLYTDGPNDYGVDCAFVDGDILYLIQGKFRTEHSYSTVYHFIEQIQDFLNLQNARNVKNDLVDVYNALHDETINEIKIYYITNNDLSVEGKKRDYIEKCENFNIEYSNKLGKNVSLYISGRDDFSKIHTGLLLELPKEIKNSSHQLFMAKFFENRDKTTVVAEIPLKDLARMVDAHKNYIFYSNIRNYKGLNAINKGIKKTYEEHPKNFWYYNNGITIVCKDYTLPNSSSSITIYSPQIVNGCQTATTICECWKESNKEEKENVDGTILVKIIKDAKSEKRKNITKYTNSQTAVTGKDFFALEDFHTELKSNFSKIGYFYEIQSNSAKTNKTTYPGNSKYRHLFDNRFNRENSFTAKEITQIYIATLLDMPARAKNIGQFMPGSEKYDKIFNDSTPTDPRFYILPFGVWYFLKKVYQIKENNIIDKDKWQTSLLLITNTFLK